MTNNTNLRKAQVVKNDEFYTQYADIEKELEQYKGQFRGKIVYCNCDAPSYSEFWRYFHLNFTALGLKKLIATHYVLSVSTYKKEYTGGKDTEIEAGVITPLKGNGDFRSVECREILAEADIVVTNPPFSLSGEFFDLLMSMRKKFLIIVSKNIVNTGVFRYLKSNEVWFGFSSPKEFDTPEGKTQKVQGICRWLTNLDIEKRHKLLVLKKSYTPDKYPIYDNFAAINVDKVADIPKDYNGVMGVPITFFDSYNPEQFEILGRSGDTDWVLNDCDFFTPPTALKQQEYKEYCPNWRVQNSYLLTADGMPINIFYRVFIKRR